jgi:hypothetical protein
MPRASLGNLVVFRSSLYRAFDDCERGKCSHTKGPVEVFPLRSEQGKYQLFDGYHRLIEYLTARKHLKNNHTIPVKIVDKEWVRKTYSIAPEGDRWEYDGSLKYGGLEDLADEEIIDDLANQLQKNSLNETNLERLLSTLFESTNIAVEDNTLPDHGARLAAKDMLREVFTDKRLQQLAGLVSEETKKTSPLPNKLTSYEVFQQIKKLHHTPEDLWGGDLQDRLYVYSDFELRIIPISKISSPWAADLADYSEMPSNTRPPIVLSHDFEIIDGTHRLAAAIKNGEKFIKAYVGLDVPGSDKTKDLYEAMIDAPPENSYIQVGGDYKRLFIEIKTPGIGAAHSPGFINLTRVETKIGAVWEVDNSAAKKGYGPLLYDIAMEIAGGENYIDDLGIMPDRTSVSGDAQRVWETYYVNRSDVVHEPLPEYWFDETRLSDRPLYLRHYYHKMGAPTVEKLARDGLIKSDDFNFFDEIDEYAS